VKHDLHRYDLTEDRRITQSELEALDLRLSEPGANEARLALKRRN